MAKTPLQADSACANTVPGVSRRSLLAGVAPAVAVIAMPSAALAAGPTDLKGWEQAKAAYLAAVAETDFAAKKHGELEGAAFADRGTAPTATIEYTRAGFTTGPITLAPHRSKLELTKNNYRGDHAVASVGDTPEYAAFCRAVAEWDSRPDRAELTARLHAANEAFEDAVARQGDAWHAAVTFPLAHPALVAEKIDLLQPDAGDDGECLSTLLNGVAADLARIDGRA